ncbi:MAG: hypothetical protein QGI21_07410 [Candidatus Poseidoniaceae archaeon]|jgi:hypothetical protein|nr:hypothetical protein [Candidatus Poseidoniaceae archaeon]
MKGRLTALILALLMTTTTLSAITSAESEGRQMDDVDCSGYSFEDLFEYNHALFNIDILNDWATADISANSWVNDSKASVVRTNIDGLFDGVPGGNNSWISTDEREAVREVGPKCIADMYTRVGMREGVPHRGGVDWNDFEFVEDGIGLDEVDLIPQDHPEERTCQNMLASNGCKEVPVSATNNLEISLFTKSDQTHNAQFNKLPNSGQSNFTIAVNTTNMTSAEMTLSFPNVEGLRMASWSLHDDAVENLEAGSVTEIHMPDGSMKISIDTAYDRSQWPLIRHFFIDMTTSPPESNDVPMWTENAPSDNTIIPMILDSGETVAVSGDTLANWASDEDAWGLDCTFDESGWSSRINSNGDLLVTSGSSESGTATCSIVDPYGAANNATKTWRFGQPATFTAAAGIYSDSVDIEATPSLLVQNLAVSLSASQSGNNGPASQFNLGTSTQSQSVSLSSLFPGEFMIRVTATADGMLDWDTMIDLDLEKENTPPVIYFSVELDGTFATWSADQYSFSVSGTAIDPDGGEVTMKANLCGEETTSFTRNGVNWDLTLSVAKCMADGISVYDVIITATDSTGAIGTASVTVEDPFIQSNNQEEESDATGESESGLPSISMAMTIMCLAGAAILLRREQ